MNAVENLPVIHIFHQSLPTIQLILISDAVIQRLILDIFEYQPENILLNTIVSSRTFQEKFSAVTYFLISYMFLLSYKRNMLLENWKDANLQNSVVNTEIFQKIISTSNQNAGSQEFLFERKFK